MKSSDSLVPEARDAKPRPPCRGATRAARRRFLKAQRKLANANSDLGRALASREITRAAA